MQRRVHPLGYLLFFVLLPCLVAAQDDDVVTARQHYQEVLSAAQAAASDAALILVMSGADIVGSGQAHNWRYFFRSASLNRILLFIWEQDDQSVHQAAPLSGEPPPIALHVDMQPIPASWIDSNVALAEADANGGNDYRAAGNNNYHVEMVLLPPEDDGFNALFDQAAWLVRYSGEPGELGIPVDALTGTFLDFGVSTARRFLVEAAALAASLGDDLELVVVGSGLARPDGSAPIWTYYYRSASQSKFYGIKALEGRLGIVQEPIGESGILHFDMPPLPFGWLDSDTAIEDAEQQGGSAFRQTHNEWQISANVGTWEGGLPQWQIDYNSPSGSQQFTVDALTGNPATARDKLDEILATSTQVYSDAELILVMSQSIDLDGLTNQWSYFFKSVGTPDIFELKVLAGEVVDYVYPFGLNGYLDLFMTPLPYEWVDSDEAIAIAELQGGSAFRQANTDWKIVPTLTFRESGQLEWHFDYRSSSGATVFEVDAIPSNPVTARQLLSDVITRAEQELVEPRLVSVATTRMDLQGGANEWSYIFAEPGASNLTEVVVRSGEVVSTVNTVQPDEMLRLDMPALPDQWMDSDSVIAVVEQTGGAEFRQANPDIIIDVVCAWQERGPTRARNLGERPMYSVLYESDTGERFRRGVDLEFGAYATMATTTAQEKLATLTDSVETAELPADAALVNVTSTVVDYMGYADHWVYLYESPTEGQQYEYRALGGHIIRLDSARSGVSLGLAPLPNEWIDSPLALKVTEQDGGSDFRQAHPDYAISLDLKTGDVGVYWDVVYGSSTEAQWFSVDASDFSVDTEPIDVPEDRPVLQTYPNPFSTAATVVFTLAQSSNVSLVVYDILGRKRLTIMPGFMPAGPHTVPLDVPALEAGAYFVVLEAGNFVVRGRMVKVNRSSIIANR